VTTTIQCEGCGKGKGPNPFLYRMGTMYLKDGPSWAHQMTLCPTCAGKLCASLVRYHQGRKSDGLQGARRNMKAHKPLHVHGTWRCRNCEVQLPDYKVGDPPMCEECR